MAEDTEKTVFNNLDRVSFVILFLALCFFLYMAFVRTAVGNRGLFRSLTRTAETQLNALKAAKEEKTRESAAGYPLARRPRARTKDPFPRSPCCCRRSTRRPLPVDWN